MIWATTMIHNEEEMIEGVVRHLLAEGVDHVVVADNMSIDRSKAILEKLAQQYPVIVVNDMHPAFRRAEKMSALAQRAGEAGATWVIPFDADELWISPGRSLRVYFSASADVDVLIGDIYELVAPLLPRRGTPFERMVRRDKRDASLEHGTNPECFKVAFRYRGDIDLVAGNHDVISPSPLHRRHDGGLVIHRYRYRSFAHMRRKARHGRLALGLTDESNVIGSHWRLHGSRSNLRLAVTWTRLAIRQRGRIRDRQLPTTVEGNRRLAEGVQPCSSSANRNLNFYP